jgi:diaminohydroxyphosphoribosylaminopyrimidine deaminase/5-amino-6-(5-phosphoribosylamino)uracil reductase
MDAALAWAGHALTVSNPNPRVGCVLVDAQGRSIGSGHTQAAGGPHAEVMALRDAAARGEPAAGATAFVTLEPCSHHGRTPPCCDALVAAGVARVVVACQDPNPLVAGRGLQRLREAGVQVDLLPPDDPAAVAARELNIGFFSRMVRGTPWVRMKVAASLDGITALPDGQSQWITGEAARADGHAWRARACAVLTGIGTVREDNPMLDVRHVAVTRQPHLVVVDSRLETPLDARLFQPPAQGGARQVWIAHAVRDAERERALTARGAQLLHLPGAGDKVDLPALMQALAAREVNELHVEAGHKLNGSLWRSGCVDEWLVYMAPRVLGDGARMAALSAATGLPDETELQFHQAQPLGDDLRLVVRRRRGDRFLLQSDY